MQMTGGCACEWTATGCTASARGRSSAAVSRVRLQRLPSACVRLLAMHGVWADRRDPRRPCRRRATRVDADGDRLPSCTGAIARPAGGSPMDACRGARTARALRAALSEPSSPVDSALQLGARERRQTCVAVSRRSGPRHGCSTLIDARSESGIETLARVAAPRGADSGRDPGDDRRRRAASDLLDRRPTRARTGRRSSGTTLEQLRDGPTTRRGTGAAGYLVMRASYRQVIDRLGRHWIERDSTARSPSHLRRMHLRGASRSCRRVGSSADGAGCSSTTVDASRSPNGRHAVSSDGLAAGAGSAVRRGRSRARGRRRAAPRRARAAG